MGCRGLPGCSIIRASLPFANIGVLRAGRAQPLYLLTPAGRFALRATAHRADASLRRAHGFAALANIGVLRAGRAQPLYLLTPAGRFALRTTAHRADASLRCPKPCAAAQKSERCECPKGTRNAPRSTPPRISAQTARPSSTRRGRAASIQKHYHWKDPRFSRPFGRSQRSTGFGAGSAGVLPRLPASSRVSRVPSIARSARRALPPETPPSSRFFLHQAAFLTSLRSLATLTAFAAAEVFGALPQTPARA